jgi:hypothetical protein
MDVSPRTLIRLATLVVWFAALPAHALAAGADSEPSALSVSGELDLVSCYVWRTITYSDGLVLQPSVGFSAGPAEFGLWANADPSGTGSAHPVNELDYSAAWSFDLGLVEAKPSVVLYTYPGLADAGTGELQVELRRGVPGGLSAFVRHATDVFDYPGASFTAAGLDREWDFTSLGTLSLSTQVGRGTQPFSDAYLPGAPALTMIGAAASWSIPLGRGWGVRPHVDWLEVVEDEARALLPAHTPFTIGVALGRL